MSANWLDDVPAPDAHPGEVERSAGTEPGAGDVPGEADQENGSKLKTLVSAVVDKETQEKIDIIKSRLMRYFGYNEVSATDVLNYVASIFARGDAKS